jgi:CBS domain-containing protein
MNPREAVSEKVQSGLDELRRMRDKIRLDLHLASMELRDEWKELERKLPDGQAVNRLNDFTKEAVDALAEEVRRFRTRLRSRRGTGDVSRLMAGNPATCASTETLAQAVTRMWDLDIGWLPVVDEGRLVGVITDRDACIAACTRGKRMDDVTVGSAMSGETWSCGPHDTREEALALMREHRIRRLPVKDEQGRLAGVITLGDLARASAADASQRRASDGAEVVAALAEFGTPRSSILPMH